MQISKNTQDLLKNFSSINAGIVVKQGNEISTMSIAKTIVAFANVPETFPVQFGIYDLNNLISTLGLFSDPDLEFGETFMTITSGAAKCSYGYSEEGVIMSPKRRVAFPGGEVEFVLTKDTFDRIMKASSTLNLPLLCVTKDKDSNILLKATDPRNPNGNDFSVVVGRDTSDSKYEFYIQSEFMKMIRGDYKVSISSRFISRFVLTGTELDLEYFVSVEKNSKFDGVALPLPSTN